MARDVSDAAKKKGGAPYPLKMIVSEASVAVVANVDVVSTLQTCAWPT